MNLDSVNLELVSDLPESLSRITKTSISAKKNTTSAVGGSLPVLIEPNSIEDLKDALTFVHRNGIRCRYLGAGSNLLVSDDGIADWVIRLGRGFRTFQQITPGLFEVGGSMSLMSLSRNLSQEGFSGLEFAGGIPASLGGAVRMNAGAHGGEMSSVLEEVQIATPEGFIEWVQASDLSFSYRYVDIPVGSLVVSSKIRLKASDVDSTAALRAEYLAARKATQPLTYPSSGSVFKNPDVGPAAGALIEQVGLRGHTIGGASVSEIHGNWIVNLQRQAKYSDVIALVELCRTKVMERFSVNLQLEMVLWGNTTV